MADYSRLILIVDSVPETMGMGVVVVDSGRQQVLRRPMGNAGGYVVFQFQSGPAGNRAPAAHSSGFWSELWGAGVSTAGAAVSGIGVVAATAAEPETAGLSTPAVVLLWGGLTASVAQCGVSYYRLANVVTGHEDVNQAMDQSAGWRATMYVLDGVGLIGAGGALKEVAATSKALKAAGVSEEVATAGRLTRQQRLAFTAATEGATVKRLSNRVISAYAKRQLLDRTAAAIGMLSSSAVGGGIVHDVVILVVTSPDT